MTRLALAAVAAWLLDLGTAHPAIEANPVVRFLGPDAPLVKLAVLGFALLAAALLLRWGERYMAALVLAAVVVVGCVGATSNLAAASSAPASPARTPMPTFRAEPSPTGREPVAVHPDSTPSLVKEVIAP